MPWWSIFLIGAGSALVVVLILWLLIRSTKSGAIDAQIKESEARRLKEELEAEKKAKEAITEELKALAEEKKKIAAWYNETKAQITREAKDEYEKLATDPDTLDRKLDELLSPTSSRTDTTPVDPTAGQVEEGG